MEVRNAAIAPSVIMPTVGVMDPKTGPYLYRRESEWALRRGFKPVDDQAVTGGCRPVEKVFSH